MAVKYRPLVLLNAASKPTAVLLEAVLDCNEPVPIAVLLQPVVFNNKDALPTAVL